MKIKKNDYINFKLLNINCNLFIILFNHWSHHWDDIIHVFLDSANEYSWVLVISLMLVSATGLSDCVQDAIANYWSVFLIFGKKSDSCGVSINVIYTV